MSFGVSTSGGATSLLPGVESGVLHFAVTCIGEDSSSKHLLEEAGASERVFFFLIDANCLFGVSRSRGLLTALFVWLVLCVRFPALGTTADSVAFFLRVHFGG